MGRCLLFTFQVRHDFVGAHITQSLRRLLQTRQLKTSFIEWMFIAERERLERARKVATGL